MNYLLWVQNTEVTGKDYLISNDEIVQDDKRNSLLKKIDDLMLNGKKCEKEDIRVFIKGKLVLIELHPVEITTKKRTSLIICFDILQYNQLEFEKVFLNNFRKFDLLYNERNLNISKELINNCFPRGKRISPFVIILIVFFIIIIILIITKWKTIF